MPKLRIAILCESFPPDPCGGIGTSCFNLFSGLKNKGYPVKVFTITNGSPATDTSVLYRTGFPNIIKTLLSRLVAGWINLQERGGLKYQCVDMLLGVLYGLKLKRAIKKYNPDIIVVPDKGMSNLFIKAPKHCKVVFVSHHNPMRFIGEPLIGKHSVIDAQLAVKLQQKALGQVDGVICPSLYMQQVFDNTYTFNRPVAVIGNIADVTSISAVSPLNLHDTYGIPVNSPIIYIPSAGSLIKGSVFVFEIIRRLSTETAGTIGFYLSGGINPELSRLLEFVPENAKLIMPGKTSYQDNMAHIKGCSLCVSPTLLENFGMALLEAQICGLPCISFAVGGNSDVVADGVTGFLVPFLDIEQLIKKTNDLLQNNKLRAEMSLLATSRTKELFNADNCIDTYIDFFKQIQTQ